MWSKEQWRTHQSPPEPAKPEAAEPIVTAEPSKPEIEPGPEQELPDVVPDVAEPQEVPRQSHFPHFILTQLQLDSLNKLTKANFDRVLLFAQECALHC